MHVDLTINPDDTVSMDMIVAISDEAAKALGMEPQEAWDMAGTDLTTDMPEGAKVTPYKQDGYTGSRFTLENQPLGGADGLFAGDSLSIVREGDEYVVSGEMDMTDEGGDMEGMEGMDIRVSMTFPGRVIEANGTIEGNKVTWVPAIGEVTEFSARAAASPGGGGSLWLIIAIVAAVLVIGGVVVGVVMASKKKAAAAAAAAPMAGAPMGYGQPPAYGEQPAYGQAPAYGEPPAAPPAPEAAAAPPEAPAPEAPAPEAPAAPTEEQPPGQ